jgi:hypothetical protein
MRSQIPIHSQIGYLNMNHLSYWIRSLSLSCYKNRYWSLKGFPNYCSMSSPNCSPTTTQRSGLMIVMNLKNSTIRTSRYC